MKYATIVLALLLTIACKNQESKQEDVVTERPQEQLSDTVSEQVPITVNTIENIKQAYETTNRDLANNRYTSTSLTYNCNGERGGKVIYYLSNNTLRLIEHTHNEYSHNEATDRYYIANNQPYFIFYKRTTWQFDGEANVEGATKDDITENRYYLLDNTLTQCLEKKYTIRSTLQTTDPNTVQNNNISCPEADKLLEAYNKLLENKDKQGDVGCL